MPIRSDAEWPVQDAWRAVPTGSEGDKNALVHGLYTAEAVRQRKEISVLLRAARALAFHGGGSPNGAGMPCRGLILRFRSIPSPVCALPALELREHLCLGTAAGAVGSFARASGAGFGNCERLHLSVGTKSPRFR
jgi:hypothetical protein